MLVRKPSSLRSLTPLLVLALPACFGSTTRGAQMNLSSALPTSASVLAGTGSAPEASCRTPTPSMTTTIQPTVSWVFANDPGDRLHLDRWCAGVGPAVSVSPFDSTLTSATASSLVVVTWNVHIGSGDIPGLVRDLKAGKFTDGKPVEHFVLMLQEVYRSGADVPVAAGAGPAGR